MNASARTSSTPSPLPPLVGALLGLAILVPLLGLIRHGVSWDRDSLLRANEMPWAPWPWALLAAALLVAWQVETHDGRPRKVVRNVAVVGWMGVVILASFRDLRDLGGLVGVAMEGAAGLAWAIVLVAAGRESVRTFPVRTPHTAWLAGIVLAGHAWLTSSLSELGDGGAALVLPVLVLVLVTTALRWRGRLFATHGYAVAGGFVACFGALAWLTSTGTSAEARLDAAEACAGGLSLVLVGAAYGLRRARADGRQEARRAG